MIDGERVEQIKQRWAFAVVNMPAADIRAMIAEARAQLAVCLPLDVPLWRARRDSGLGELARRAMLARRALGDTYDSDTDC